MTAVQRQNIMTCIEENTERLDLMQKTLAVEEKQKKRLMEASIQKEQELQQANIMQLFEGNSTADSVLNQEEAHRKQLVDHMLKNTSPSIAPVVKVVNNVQGMLTITFHKDKYYLVN